MLRPMAFALRAARLVGRNCRGGNRCRLALARVTLLLLFTQSAFAGSPDAPVVIWLSLDGVRHDYPDRGSFPGLERMAREGVRAARLIPIFPSSTFPNHVAMATCTRADRHGIVGNRFLDRARGEFSYGNDASWIDAEPIWASAERQGVRSAVFFWVGSETAWRGVAASHRSQPFDDEISESVKVDQILAWLDLPASERPGLILSWWRGTDRVGHAKGPDHPEIRSQLAAQDGQLERLLAGLDSRSAWARTTLFVTSDHGMTTATHEIDAPEVLARAGIEAHVHSGAGVAYVTLADASEAERARGVLSEVPGHTVFRAADVPQALRIRHASRTGDLILVARPPYFFASGDRLATMADRLTRWLGWAKGTHGYLPSHPDMAGIFYAMGRGVAGDLRLGSVSNLDIAPTVSALLGIEPPQHCEGEALLYVDAPGEGQGAGR